MIAANIIAYLELYQLPEDIKRRNGIKTGAKIPRYDLYRIAGYYQALERIKNRKGQIYFNLIANDRNPNRRRDGSTPEYYLQTRQPKVGAINFTGLRHLYINGKMSQYASGEASMQPILKGGVENPFFDCRNDGYLFLISPDEQKIEVLIIENGRLLIDSYRKQLYLGGFDEVLQSLQEQAKPIFNY